MDRADPYSHLCTVQLFDVKRELAELKSGSYQHKRELDRILSEKAQNMQDPYSQLMLPFLQTASEELSRLSDQVQKTERIYADVLRYYAEGPDARRRGFPAQQLIPTEDFFGIFREFVVSYRKAQKDNAFSAEQRQREDKRRAAAQEREREKQLAQQRKEAAAPDDSQLLETLLGNLRQTGGPTGRHRYRSRDRRHPALNRSLGSNASDVANATNAVHAANAASKLPKGRQATLPPSDGEESGSPSRSQAEEHPPSTAGPPAGVSTNGSHDTSKGLQPPAQDSAHRHSTSSLAEKLLAQLQGGQGATGPQTAEVEDGSEAGGKSRRRVRPRHKLRLPPETGYPGGEEQDEALKGSVTPTPVSVANPGSPASPAGTADIYAATPNSPAPPLVPVGPEGQLQHPTPPFS